jgi:hypothetical protein
MQNINWTALSACAQILCALGTFMAVKAAFLPFKKKIKIECVDTFLGLKIGDDPQGNMYMSTILSVSNAGNKKITISDWGVKIKGFDYISMADGTEPQKIILDSEASTNLPCPYSKFSKAIDNSTSSFENEMNKQKIRFYIRDSTGKTYFAVSKSHLSDYSNKGLKNSELFKDFE